LVPNVLLLAIAVYGGRVLLPIPPPIVRVTGPPFLWAIQAYLAVFRVRRDLPVVIFSAAPALAAGVATHCLRRLKLRGLKDPLAVEASPFTHKGRCLINRTATLGELYGGGTLREQLPNTINDAFGDAPSLHEGHELFVEILGQRAEI